MNSDMLHEWSWHFYSSPWLDVCFFNFDAPTAYMPAMPRKIARATGIAGLLLLADFTQAEKESLMIGFVQYVSTYGASCAVPMGPGVGRRSAGMARAASGP